MAGVFDLTACGALGAITKHCGPVAGFTPNSIYIAEAADIESIPAPGAGTKQITTDIVMDATKFFFQWVTVQTGAVLSREPIGTKGTQQWKNTCTFYIPVVRSVVLEEMDNVLNDQFVLIVPDSEGTLWLCGTAYSPAMVAEGGIQSVMDGENNGSTITFEWYGSLFEYSGAITTS